MILTYNWTDFPFKLISRRSKWKVLPSYYFFFQLFHFIQYYSQKDGKQKAFTNPLQLGDIYYIKDTKGYLLTVSATVTERALEVLPDIAHCQITDLSGLLYSFYVASHPVGLPLPRFILRSIGKHNLAPNIQR